ncbi:MAG: hypothetical protein CMO10_12665 [Thalassospira sp.]|nr:hypothetical protein [Thalassospira sp.]
MYDAGLYPLEAIRLLQDHWQKTKGKPDHSARLKGAANRAAITKRRKAGARKAAASRAAKKT